jgi:hypothetical protein
MGRLGISELLIIFIALSIIGLIIASYWTLFEKAGKPGWASIVPIYNIIVQLEIIKKPGWWFILMIIPYVGLVWNIWALNLLLKSFGKNEGYTVACLFLPFIFLPMLAFNKSTQFTPL